jgi:hypothetical protein
MDLGILAKTAIVCPASQEFGRAEELAEVGVNPTINARNADLINKTAKHIAQTCSVKITPIPRGITGALGRADVLAACPDPDILVNNARGNHLEISRTVNQRFDNQLLMSPLQVHQRRKTYHFKKLGRHNDRPIQSDTSANTKNLVQRALSYQGIKQDT